LTAVSVMFTSPMRRCQLCISIAMSYIRLRSASVSATSGSAVTRSGRVSIALPSMTSETL
jgi:hypothetical protein